MTDTVLTELKIHEFDTVAQFLQHESEVGENDLALTPFMPANLYLFYHNWADHIVNDPSWLRADTFSWQSGDVYVAAYKHLVADAKTAYAWISGSEIFYTSKETVAVGDEVYVSTTKDSSTIDSVGSNTIAFAHPRKDGVYTATRSTANDRLALGLMPFMRSETIGNTTIEFIVADDGHKICAPDQESNLIALYEATGSAWYYVLDMDNKQFKLPRELPLYADHAPIYGNTACQGDGNGAKGAPLLASTDDVSGTKGITTGGSSGTAGVEYYVGFQQIENAYADVGALRVASDGSQKHLYFYVGHFEQDSVEQTAGINAETFNAKADRNLMNTSDNVDIVIESQLPTEENGYTWYRKYKSGWVEQGGVYTIAGASFADFNLIVPMADSNYTATGNSAGATSNVYPLNFSRDKFTTTTFSAKTGNAGSGDFYWQVSGMSA
jgi:hypothetical protein